jgi:putative endonuclease
VGRRFSRDFGKPGEHNKEIVKIISFFFAAMFYVYILYSEVADRYYVGHTNDPGRRLIEHNTVEEIKFTTKFRPWAMLLAFEVSESRGDAIRVERFIKRQKSRTFIRKLIESGDDRSFIKAFVRDVVG